MKLKLLLLLLFLQIFCTNAQTDCSFDETKFTGTFTTTEVGGTKIKASDATSNYRFGERVAIDGNIAVTTSRANGTEAGKVYIFTNDGTGNWTQQTTLTASDGFAGDNFGSSVAIEGNYLVVGASSQTNSSAIDTGAAYLFEYDGSSTWTEVAIFEPGDGSSGDRFGVSVSIEGNFILIGARDGCVGGCAYLYENDETNTFTYSETKLEPQVQSNYSGARFGYDVLVKGGRAYVGGLYDYSSVGNASAGSVQIWDQANDGSWSRTHRLRGTQTSEAFGSSISVDGDYLAIGAYNYEVGSTSAADQGRVYVYKADTNGDYLDSNRVMVQNTDKDSFTDQRFGTDVAIENGFLYVGTWGDGTINGDAVYIFKDDGTNTWSQLSKLTSGGGWDEFSNRAVAVSHPYLLIGQNEDDSPSNSGAIHFVPLASTVTPTASITGFTEAFIGQNNATITLDFSDEVTRTEIQFSIDGGTTFPYTFNDDALTGEITNLGIGSYDLKARFNNGSCDLDLGTVTINQAAYTAIPDTNFEARLEALGYDDISGDGQVPTALIEVVTTLTVNGKSVADFTGIEDFVSLTYLDVGNNSITNLDVSNLTLLEFLRVDANNLTTLDLSTNTALVDLRCSYNSGITSIDLSNLTFLETAHLSHNNLTSVNVSNNTLLYELSAVSNDITTIDLSANVALEELNLSSNSNLNVLDVANNTLLEQLYANNCGLTSVTSINTTVLSILSVSNNNLTSLDVSNTVDRLFELSVAENNLTNLDLTGASSLFKLTAYTNNIESLDLSSTTHIEFVNVADNNLSFLNMKNGANDLVLSLNTINNPLLACILVDDAAYSTSNWTNIDGTSSFSDTYCRYTTIPDPIFEARLEALGYDDISGDGQVPTALIEVVTSLTLNDLGINNATGIEDFAALVTLNARGNNFTTLDVSQNTLLQHLYINSNSLSSIDVSNNVVLRNLNIGSNGITTLDLSNNPDLRDLWVQGNGGLTTIDLSNNLELRELYTYSSGVSTLDLSIHTELRILSAYRTPLASIDLSNNIELRSLRVDETNVLSLDLTNNTKLETLRVNDTGIISLDLSNQSVLEKLWAHDTSLSNLNVRNGNNANVATFEIENNPNLTCVLVDDASYSTTNWTNIPSSLVFSEVYCDYTAIPDANFEARLEALGYDDISGDGQVPTALIETIITLDINSQNIADITGIEAFVALEELSAALNTFTSLDLSNNTVLRILVTKFTPITTLNISVNTQLEQLVCSFNDLNSLDVSNNTALTYLECNNNNLSSLDLSNNADLLDLRCDSNNLTAIDVSNNTALTSFWCNDNFITDIDLSNQTGLVSIVVNNNTLTGLNVQNGNNTNVTNFVATGNAELTCILVDDATYSTTNWLGIDNTASFSETTCITNLSLALQVYLQGPLTTSGSAIMDDSLRSNNLLPTTSPYADNLTCESTVFSITGDDAIIDWVWITLRDSNDQTTIVASQSALLQADGDVVAADGTSSLEIDLPADNYYVAVRHRNHLGIMTANTVYLDTPISTVDLTSNSAAISGGSNAVADMNNGIIAMISGDFDENGQIQNSDINSVIQLLGSSGYNNADIDMNGQIQNIDINNLMNPNIGKGEQF